MPTQTLLIDGKKNRATVTGLIFNHEGKLLVGHSLRYPDANYWQLPQGGKEIGEHPFRAMMRETGEELGLTRRSVKPIIASTEFPAYSFPDHNPHEWYDEVRLGCQALLLREGGRPDLKARKNNEAPEFDEISWIDPARLPERAPPHKIEAYKKIVWLFDPLAQGIPSFSRALSRDRSIVYELRRSAADIAGQYLPTLQQFPGKPLRGTSPHHAPAVAA